MFRDRHEEIFDKIYDASIFNMDTSIMSDNEKRKLFESTRRYLDICRTINKKWPLTNRFVCAKEKKDIVLDVFDSFHKKVRKYSDVHDGCLSIYQDIVINIGCGKYRDLLEKESQYSRIDDLVDAVNDNEKDETLSLLLSLNFYRNASAHDFLYRGLLINGQ